MKFNKVFLACLVLSGSALLSACGGSSDSAAVPPPQVATTSTAAVITSATGATVISSVLDKTFDFTTGVPSFGTTSATSLKLSGTGATPSFAISSAEGTASGAMTYGSCIFTVTQSTFAAGHPLALSNSFAVSPCSLTVGTAGVKADGSPYPTTVTLVLGTINSNPISVTVSISSTGVVTVNNFTIGTTTLVAATGAGS
jgi:hypothetical protein